MERLRKQNRGVPGRGSRPLLAGLETTLSTRDFEGGFGGWVVIIRWCILC